MYLTFLSESLWYLHNKYVIKTFTILNSASTITDIESIVNETLTVILPSFHKIFMIGKIVCPIGHRILNFPKKVNESK